VGNDGINWVDYHGYKKYKSGSHNANETNRGRNETIKNNHNKMVDKMNEPSNVEKVLDGAGEILDLIEDPIGSVGEAVARRAAKQRCDKLYEEGDFKEGCACCIVTLKSSSVLIGGADAPTNWVVHNTVMRPQSCQNYHKEIDEAKKQMEKDRKERNLPELPKMEYIGGDNEINIKMHEEYLPY
jgi:hypothetical protein